MSHEYVWAAAILLEHGGELTAEFCMQHSASLATSPYVRGRPVEQARSTQEKSWTKRLENVKTAQSCSDVDKCITST